MWLSIWCGTYGLLMTWFGNYIDPIIERIEDRMIQRYRKADEDWCKYEDVKQYIDKLKGYLQHKWECDKISFPDPICSGSRIKWGNDGADLKEKEKQKCSCGLSELLKEFE